ncbi:uncharacterized protein LOC128880175 isoform X1 [Hylaeus volcanicus]|uniref:uncharacterized protein LOC128880175 isoform X1 n=1 Tax=Hylaeus volcanicus TaxID=313075 RepID=UPI0023B7C72D|nr:uncharacterized protein LOC128880175 isoform X1 [Hylaeus volcanicus]XP_053985950.1 uncharacterized protein LOC128880175 isoform X1 [Hylaeus volcanicus]XP_053985959.1 uncharacterized protein LOC128880175 isoform X1 [Hylaeus volcanicus]XP_053985967.1 uncharacterized protein LOC128880175 isoform X1 [Hylaeus volcanicus]
MVHADVPSTKTHQEEDTSKMATASAMSLPRLEKKTMPAYDDSIVLRLSNDFEGIIEQIENLRLARDRETGKRCESMVERTRRESTELERTSDCGANFSGPLVSSSTSDDDSGADDSDDHSEGLVERGPIKSQYISTPRDQPYWTNGGFDRSLKLKETSILDYDVTAEQLLQDKDYSEKLNACLDQLQDASRTVWNSLNDSKNRNASEPCSSNTELALGSPIVTSPIEPSEDTLLDILSRGGFQAAQSFSENNFLNITDTTSTWQNSLISGSNAAASRSESSGSSCARSPCPATCAESLQIPRMNLLCSPIGPHQVAATTYRPSQILSSSSNSSSSLSSFSSSSNQSYGDTPSPTDCRGLSCSRIEERLGEDLENLSFWNEACESFRNSGLNDCEIAAQNSIGNGGSTEIVDTIDNSELQLIEEVLRGLGDDRHDKEETRRSESSSESDNAACLLSFENAPACQESLRENSTDEQYLSNCNGNAVESSPVSYTTQKNIPYIQVVPDYPKNGQPEISRTDSGRDIDFAALLQSSCHSSSTADATVIPNVSAQLSLFERQRKKSFEQFRSTKWTDTSDDFQIPKVVACFESSRSQRRRNSDRNIMPWPSLNLPSVKASERLKEGLNPKEVERAMSCLLKRSVEELAKQDEDGDTMLMCLVGNPDELVDKKAYLAPLVERLSIANGALTATNNRGEDALYLAALNCPEYSYVTGYLAATMLQKGIDVSQRLYHTRGDTLIHSVAAQGDSHGEVLAELLALKTVQGNAVFDLSKRNYDGRTALHVAVQTHDPTRGIVSVATVRLLLKYGADPRIKETKCGDTALHMAVSLSCDPALVKMLLAAHGSDLANATNYNLNTALHMAASVSNNVTLERQKEVFWLLTQAGGYTNQPNRQGKTPLALVPAERKSAIRKIFYKRS